MEPTAEQIDEYEGNCALCKFFRPAYERGPAGGLTLVLDDPGWCVRYPPVFVGGERAPGDECEANRYMQPGVWGHDECGEYVRNPKL